MPSLCLPYLSFVSSFFVVGRKEKVGDFWCYVKPFSNVLVAFLGCCIWTIYCNSTRVSCRESWIDRWIVWEKEREREEELGVLVPSVTGQYKIGLLHACHGSLKPRCPGSNSVSTSHVSLWFKSSNSRRCFGCQKHVKGVVTNVHHSSSSSSSSCCSCVCVCVCGASFSGWCYNCKKLETIESNSFAWNHRRVKLRDNIVSCLCPFESCESYGGSCVRATTRGNVFRIWNWIAQRLSKKSTTQTTPIDDHINVEICSHAIS